MVKNFWLAGLVCLLLLVGCLSRLTNQSWAFGSNKTAAERCVQNCIESQKQKRPDLWEQNPMLIIVACQTGCAQTFGQFNSFEGDVEILLLNHEHETQCCRCCFDIQQTKCVDIMGVNRCRERGGRCTSNIPCFGRD